MISPGAAPDAGSPADQVHPVLVIGGGVSGLVAALDLARAGLAPVLLEASGSCGGVLSAHTVGGLALDAGAESFATARAAVGELLADVGLADRIVPPNPVGAWVRHRRGTAPLPAMGFLGIPGRPWAADVRRVIGLPGSVRCMVDGLAPVRSAPPAGTTLGGLVRSRMGRRVLDRLVEPVAGGVYATDPDTLEVQSVAPTLPAAMVGTGSLAGAARQLRGGGERPGSAVATIAGGMHLLAGGLDTAVRAAGGEIRVNNAVDRLTRNARGWRAELADGQAISASSVVLALPAPQAADLLVAALPGVSVSVLRAPITPVLICTLLLDEQRLDVAPRGTGVLVSAHATGVRAKALTHATAKWQWLAEIAGPGRHVLRLSYGRGGTATLPDETDLPGLALADAAELLGVPLSASRVLDADVVRWTAALPAPRPGHAEAVRVLRAELAGHELAVVGAAVAGSGLAGVVADARQQARRLIERSADVARIAGATVPGARWPAAG